MKPRQLTIRDMFWLMLVVGLMLGWWIEHRVHLASGEAYARDAVRSHELLTSLRVEAETLRMKLRRLQKSPALDPAANDP